MILALMTRAILGHTRRELVASPSTIAIYGLITLGALLRISTALYIFDYAATLQVAAIGWGSTLVLFLATFGPMLLGNRLGKG